MGKQTSNDVREIVIDLHKKEISVREIVERNLCTIKKFIDKLKKYRKAENLQRGRPPKCLTDNEVRSIFRKLKTNPALVQLK